MTSRRNIIGGLFFACIVLPSFAQQAPPTPASMAFEDLGGGPSLKEVAHDSRYALTKKIPSTLLPALPSLADPSTVSGAHYLLKGDLTAGSSTESRNSYPSQFLVSQASISDAAVVGTIISQGESQPLQDGTFLYTPLRVDVGEVLFDKTHHLSKGKEITVVRPGGSAVIDGVTVFALDPGFAWQSVGGRYVFYLHRVPGEKNVFRIYAGGSYKLAPNDVVQPDMLEKNIPLSDSLRDHGRFLTEVTDAFKKVPIK